jgi:hypothetical protein
VNSEIYRDLIEELHVLGEKKAMQYQRISELRGLLSLQLAIAGRMRRELKHIADLLISLSCILVRHPTPYTITPCLREEAALCRPTYLIFSALPRPKFR